MTRYDAHERLADKGETRKPAAQRPDPDGGEVRKSDAQRPAGPVSLPGRPDRAGRFGARPGGRRA